MEDAVIRHRDPEQDDDAERRQRHRLPPQEPRRDGELEPGQGGAGGGELGREDDAAERPERHEEAAADRPEHQFGVLPRPGRDPVEGPHHRLAEDRPLKQRADEQGQERDDDELLETIAQYLAEPDGRASDVECTEPFDMGTGPSGARDEDQKGSRHCTWAGQPTTRTHVVKP